MSKHIFEQTVNGQTYEVQIGWDRLMQRSGYILHMDGTCEGGSPHLFSCIDAISDIVPGNRKMPTEDSQYIISLLKDLKTAYGDPVALCGVVGTVLSMT